MFKFLTTVLLIISSIAIAQTPAPSGPADSTSTAERFENDCTHLYPAAAAKIGAEGVTVVSVHVTAEGAVTNPQIAETSGNADLDKAALICLSNARVQPMKQGGMAIEGDTQVQVLWRRSFFSGAPAPKGGNGCHLFYPPLAMRLGHQGDVLLSFTIAEDGTAKNVAVKKSSGYEELDQASLTCVAGFKHWPVTQNGRPVSIDSATTIKWRLRQ